MTGHPAPGPAPVTVHAALAGALAELGLDPLFGLAGDGNLFLVDSYVRVHGGTYVAATHEAGAVLMAMGHARSGRRVGVATLTHGPGLTNAVTALVEGVRSHLPVVVVVGDTAIEDQHHQQAIDQAAVVAATGAGFEAVRSPADAVPALVRAVDRAWSERRPVVLDVPADWMWTEVPAAPVPARRPAPNRVGPDPDLLDRAAGIAASARRPVVLAGYGATDPGARRALLALGQRIGAPVATTLQAKGLFRDEPFDLGVFGTMSTPATIEAILASDCVLAFGASLNGWTTVQGSYLAGKRVVHCDADPASLGRFAPVDVALVGDAARTAEAIVDLLDQGEVEGSGFRSPELAARLRDDRLDPSPPVPAGTVDLRAALAVVDEVVPRDRTLVTDGGRFIWEALLGLSVPEPDAFVLSVGYGSIGLGMGMAVGAAYGRPGSPVLLVTGDGGFMLGGLGELSTAVRYGLDLIVVVCDDGAYGAEHVQFVDRGMDPGLATFDWPDLASVAEALGGRGVTVSGPEDVAGLADAVARRDRPLLIDLKIDPDAVLSMRH